MLTGSTPASARAWSWGFGVHAGQAVDCGAGGADIAVNHGFCPCPKMRGFWYSVDPAQNPWFRTMFQKQVFLLQTGRGAHGTFPTHLTWDENLAGGRPAES